jgi:hypothetical protein
MDGDNNGNQLELIGSIETTVGAIMGSKGQTLISELLHPNKSGS